MAAPGWMRRWRGSRRAVDWASAPVLAAASGEPLGQLLQLGARALLAAADADRAGLWLSNDTAGRSETGCVVEAEPGPIPEQWKHLDVSTPFLRAALESPHPLRVESIAEGGTPRPGPLIGMHSVVWIPLRARGHTFGLAMAAYSKPPGKPDLTALSARADEIALAVQHHRNFRRTELATEELRAQSRVSRAILCGVSADYILRQIVHAARRYSRAEFVALGLGDTPPVAGEGWEGGVEWLSLLHQEKFLQIWRRAFLDGRGFEILEEEFSIPAGCAHSTLDRVAALPIEGSGGVRGVLMAGLPHSEDSSEDFTRLESYALLAASALEREAAREERSESTELLRRIVQESGENLVLIDEHGEIQEASRPAATLLFAHRGRGEGTLLEEFVSSEAREAVTEWRSLLHRISASPGQEKGLFPPALEAALDRGGVIRIRLRSEVKGMGWNGLRWLIHLEDRGAQQAQREAEERAEVQLAGILDSIESGVLLADSSGRIVVASAWLASILGMESRRLGEFVTIHALMDGLQNNFLRPVETAARWRERVRQGDEANWEEFELVRPSRKIVEQFSRPLYHADGRRLGWLEVYRDITGQRLIQSKLLQTEKMAALGQLVSGIAHELNNPLTSIQGYAQLLLSRRSASDRAADTARISQEAERAGRIVKNLLLFSREAKPERRAVHLNEVIERTLSLRAYELKLENIEVELALNPSLPQTLGDAAQLQQVVLNLIVNAEQAIVMARGEESRGGRILIRTRRLAGDRLAMEVSDDGPGIAPEIASRIFDPFFTTKPPGIGTGLGLSIVYGIVQEHGGEVSVDSLPGRGTTLTVELPALSISGSGIFGEEPAAERGVAEVVRLPVLSRADGWKDILVVEDEPTVAELIADVLTEEGYRVETVLDSREALGKLRDKSYSLMICDLKMPYLDGPGLYRDLVRRENPMQHKLLFVTGDTLAPRTIEFLKSSALPYLAKPFLVEELKEAVRLAIAGIPTTGELAPGPERSRAVSKES